MHSCSDCCLVCCSKLSLLPQLKIQNNDLRYLMYPLRKDVGSAVNNASTQIQCKQARRSKLCIGSIPEHYWLTMISSGIELASGSVIILLR